MRIKNVEGKKVGDAELSSDVYGIEPNIPVVHQVVVCQDASARQVPTLQRTVTRYPAVALSLTVRRVLVVLARVLFVLVSGLVVASSLDLPLVHTHVVLTTRWSSLL